MKIKYKIIDEYGDVISHEGGDVFTTNDTVMGQSSLRDGYGCRDAAKECAEHFWNEHDGEDHGWPLKFVILGEGDVELGTYEVDVETAPRFSASEA
jgi:hypothetical protein